MAENGVFGRSITFKSFGVVMSELKQQQDFEESMDLPRASLVPRPQPGSAAERLQAHHAKYMKGNRIVSQAKWKIVRNVLVISLVSMFTFTGYNSVQMIQHTFNYAHDVRIYGFYCVHGVLLLSCLFLSPLIISHLGYKWSIVISVVPFALYMIANMFLSWVTIMPTSALTGLGIAVLWPAKSAYLTEASTQYADWAGLDAEIALNCFFGLFFMFYHTTNIWGSLISKHLLADLTLLMPQNLHNATCGAFNCFEEEQNQINYMWPDIWRVYALCGVYGSLAVLAVIIAIAFLSDDLRHKGSSLENYDSLDREEASLRVRTSRLGSTVEEDDCRTNCQLLLATFKQWGNRYQILLIPITIYSGMQQGFFWQDFTKSYFGCYMDIENLGFALITSGGAAAVSSVIYGEMVRCTGRSPLIAYGGVVQCGLLVALFFWPETEHVWPYYVIAALWGAGDAVWQTLLNGFYATLFLENKDAAFASYRFWESVGLILTFASGTYVCVYIKIYVLMGTLIIGLTGYFIVEKRIRDDTDIEDESYS